MTNTILLKTEIDDSGISVTLIARKLGISREGLYLKINGETEFKASEIAKITRVLHLSPKKRDSIFFAP